jgi:SAM-dependent methyltransferase
MQALRLVTSTARPVLDVGCGNGLALEKLRDKGLDAVGCDISIRALRDAKIHGDVVRADGTFLPFRSNTFRSILLLDALEHIAEKQRLVEECWRILANNGIFIVTTPCPRATRGLGDRRQPYDRPATYSEIRAMTEGLFELQIANGSLAIGGLSFGTRGPLSALWMKFPDLLEWCSEILLVLRKTDLGRRQISEM